MRRQWDHVIILNVQACLTINTGGQYVIDILKKEREQLINQGIEQGQQEEKYNTAKTLLLKGMTIPFIAEVTKLSEQEIAQLKTNLDTQEKHSHEK